MSDMYQVRRKGFFNWELSIAEDGEVFYTSRFWFRRSAFNLIKWHKVYRLAVGE